MKWFKWDQIIFEAIKKIEAEYNKQDPANDSADGIIWEIYNMFSLSHDEADLYYYAAIEWSTSTMACNIEFNIDLTTYDDRYVISAPWFSMEVFCSLRDCLKIIDEIALILDKYDNEKC